MKALVILLIYGFIAISVAAFQKYTLENRMKNKYKK